MSIAGKTRLADAVRLGYGLGAYDHVVASNANKKILLDKAAEVGIKTPQINALLTARTDIHHPDAGNILLAHIHSWVKEVGSVFIVHGHDEEAREAVARFLERVDLEAVILQEQPNQGRTIIEKFEAHAGEVSFAVVLITPDDVGGRPRQNVVFELGFFVAKLGRGKVCLLRKGDLEEFSDFQGVAYTVMDSGGAWKIRLAREMEAAGLPVDIAKAARA